MILIIYTFSALLKGTALSNNTGASLLPQFNGVIIKTGGHSFYHYIGRPHDVS